ncbi:hypothetical protein [Enorma sp.]|uniref:hypothetical protein n=1 Tax=Enorma sp. TaxID=1920692 RepID=UPI0025BDDDE8|nr:hypothetical protein [Enorma sp.]
MSNAKKAFLAVSSGMLALGLILMACGFALSGFSLDVFTATVDPTRDRVVLGGVEVDDYDELPLLKQIAEIGQIGIGPEDDFDEYDVEGDADPTPPPAPEAPAAPEEPEAPAAPEVGQ